MAYNATPVSPATRGGQAALSVQGNLRSALDQVAAMWAKMQALISNTPGSEMTAIADYFGIQAADGQTKEQKAQAFYDETNSLMGILASTSTDTVQRVQIRAAIEQWNARVG